MGSTINHYYFFFQTPRAVFLKSVLSEIHDKAHLQNVGPWGFMFSNAADVGVSVKKRLQSSCSGTHRLSQVVAYSLIHKTQEWLSCPSIIIEVLYAMLLKG